jgi:hypothetical protein
MFPRSPMKFSAIVSPIRTSGLLYIWPEFASSELRKTRVGSLREFDGWTARIFPHSKQDLLARELIDPAKTDTSFVIGNPEAAA